MTNGELGRCFAGLDALAKLPLPTLDAILKVAGLLTHFRPAAQKRDAALVMLQVSCEKVWNEAAQQDVPKHPVDFQKAVHDLDDRPAECEAPSVKLTRADLPKIPTGESEKDKEKAEKIQTQLAGLLSMIAPVFDPAA